jgi:DNA-binding response OmpR family regulator
MKILVVEDYVPVRRSVVRGLKEAGHVVDATGDGEEAKWYLAEFEYELLVLDLMLPGLDGLSLLKWLRTSHRPTRVLILSAKDTVEDRVRGLEIGADDYLVKPFAFTELLARVGALARRSSGPPGPIVWIDDLEIDTSARSVRRGECIIDLTPKEYSLLDLLVKNRGRVLSRDQIWNHLYDFNAEINSNVIDVFVRTLRQKLEADGSARLIQTRRGFGYFIEAES